MTIDWDRAGCTFVAGLAVASLLLSLFFGVCWIGRLGIDIASWAKTGEWPSYIVLSLLDDVGLALPHTDLMGVQKIITWVGEQAALRLFFVLAVGLYASFFLLGAASASCFDEVERVRAREERRLAGEEDYTFEDFMAGKEPPENIR
ncbi:hypothetical protein [Bradyrhizobium archetypum]|uniref:Uncharacterized protein n=1 Tax=Bradyrhizobium archetypum TaxID=2721160 RepID=A0A7Y4GZ79_9BRAD|nr:hypothetical protein [Bradyrhizobium archetypum]NOJ44721.1 hypothetical protein [Bradyrhizobium archetypum]